jgi:hypothetical protein
VRYAGEHKAGSKTAGINLKKLINKQEHILYCAKIITGNPRKKQGHAKVVCMEKSYARLMLFAPLLAVIFISGCTTTTTGLGNGVSVLNFEPDLPQGVFSGDTIRLQLRLQNQGESTAKDVQVELANIDTNDWGTFGLFGFSENLGDILPYDALTNTPGGIKTHEWRLQAPELAKGTSFTYEPMVKVSYDYRTVAQKPITLVDVDELRRLIQQGKSLPNKPTEFTAGPLGVEIKTGDFVSTSSGASGGESYEVFPVYIKITNKDWEAGGSVIKDGFGGLFEGYDYPVRVKITPPSGVTSRSFGTDACSSFNFDTMDLWQGKDAEITCEFEVTNPPSYRQEVLFTVDLEYRYQTQASTRLQVTGTEEGFGWF